MNSEFGEEQFPANCHASAAQSTMTEKSEPEAPAAPEMSPKMFVVPALMLGMRYFKIDANDYLDELRLAFGTTVLLNLVTLMVIFFIARANKEKGMVKVTDKMKGETKEMTIQEYDLGQIQSKTGQALFGLCVTGFIHYKWGNATPLLFQAIMIPLGLFEDKLFQIHLLGRKPEGKLQRPFLAPPSPFGDLAKSLQEPAAEEEKPETKKIEGKKAKSKKAD